MGRRACTVLILGESGVGKELVARRIHAQSPRVAQPFVPVDCTAFSETLFESQLFGHVKGAFTGAEQATLGFFRAADRGTLFLDEIGELAPTAQAKLLRSIQDRAVVPLGGVKPLPVDVRILAATHRDLPEMVRAGRFREDLHFRLNVVRINVPPLRDRRDDIGLLAEHYLASFAELYQEPAKTLSAEALATLKSYHWPGNVRELHNAIEHACVFCGDRVVGVADLPSHVRPSGIAARPDVDPPPMSLEEAERRLIGRALRAAGGNQAEAARLLNFERHRLYRKISRYRLHSLTRHSAP